MATCKWFITFLIIVVLFIGIRAIDGSGTEDNLMNSVFGSLTPLTKTLSDAKSEYVDNYLNRLRPKRHADGQCDVDHAFPLTKKAKREVGNTKQNFKPLHLSLGSNKQKHYAIPNVSAAKESTSNVVPFFVTPRQNRNVMMTLKPKSLDTDKCIFSKDTEDLQNKESIKDTKKEVSVKDEASKSVNHDSGKDKGMEVSLNKNELFTVHSNLSAYNKDSPTNVVPLDRNEILNTLYKKGIQLSKDPYFEESLLESNNTDRINTGTQKTVAKTMKEENYAHEDVPHEDFEKTNHLDCAKTDENKSNHTMVLDKTNITFDAPPPTIRSLTLETSHIPLNLNKTINMLPLQKVSGAPAMDINNNGPKNNILIENLTAEEVRVPHNEPDNILPKTYTGYRPIDTNSYNQWYSLPLSSTVGGYSSYPRIYNGEVNNIQNTNFYNFLNALRYQKYLRKYIDTPSTFLREDQEGTDRTCSNTRIFLPNSPIEQTIEINIKNGDTKIHSVEILPACNQNTRPIIAYSNGYYDNQNIQPSYLQ